MPQNRRDRHLQHRPAGARPVGEFDPILPCHAAAQTQAHSIERLGKQLFAHRLRVDVVNDADRPAADSSQATPPTTSDEIARPGR